MNKRLGDETLSQLIGHLSELECLKECGISLTCLDCYHPMVYQMRSDKIHKNTCESHMKKKVTCHVHHLTKEIMTEADFAHWLAFKMNMSSVLHIMKHPYSDMRPNISPFRNAWFFLGAQGAENPVLDPDWNVRPAVWIANFHERRKREHQVILKCLEELVVYLRPNVLLANKVIKSIFRRDEPRGGKVLSLWSQSKSSQRMGITNRLGPKNSPSSKHHKSSKSSLID